MTAMTYDIFETPHGWVGVLASERGIRRTTLPEQTIEACRDKLGEAIDEAERTPDRFVELRHRIERFLGRRKRGLRRPAHRRGRRLAIPSGRVGGLQDDSRRGDEALPMARIRRRTPQRAPRGRTGHGQKPAPLPHPLPPRDRKRRLPRRLRKRKNAPRTEKAPPRHGGPVVGRYVADAAFSRTLT